MKTQSSFASQSASSRLRHDLPSRVGRGVRGMSLRSLQPSPGIQRQKARCLHSVSPLLHGLDSVVGIGVLCALGWRVKGKGLHVLAAGPSTNHQHRGEVAKKQSVGFVNAAQNASASAEVPPPPGPESAFTNRMLAMTKAWTHPRAVASGAISYADRG